MTLKQVRKQERAWFRKQCVFKIIQLLDAQLDIQLLVCDLKSMLFSKDAGPPLKEVKV